MSLDSQNTVAARQQHTVLAYKGLTHQTASQNLLRSWFLGG